MTNCNFEKIVPWYEDANAIVMDNYSISGHITVLEGERYQNVRITLDENTYALATLNFGEHFSEAVFHNKVLKHLEKIDPSLRIPRVIAGNNGAEVMFLKQNNGLSIRVLSLVEGTSYAAKEKTAKLKYSVGQFLGRFSSALQTFKYKIDNKTEYLLQPNEFAVYRDYIDTLKSDKNRALLVRMLSHYDKIVAPLVPKLRTAVIHQCVNNYNIVVNDVNLEIGLVDTGNMVFSWQVNELAATLANMLMNSNDLISDGGDIVAGYCSQFSLTDEEFAALPVQVAMYLMMKAFPLPDGTKHLPNNNYRFSCQDSALELLKRLDKMNLLFVTCAWRKAAGKSATLHSNDIVNWIKENRHVFKPIFGDNFTQKKHIVTSMAENAPGNNYLSDPDEHWMWIKKEMANAGVDYTLGLYKEDRVCYRAKEFAAIEGTERRSVHLGMDIFINEGTPIYAPIDGVVESIVNNDASLDYGPTIILKHNTGETGRTFFTLYGHLSLITMETVSVDQKIKSGDLIGFIGAADVNGGWAPHLHFQIVTDLLGQSGTAYGVAEPSRLHIWEDISPNPNLIVCIPEITMHEV